MIVEGLVGGIFAIVKGIGQRLSTDHKKVDKFDGQSSTQSVGVEDDDYQEINNESHDYTSDKNTGGELYSGGYYCRKCGAQLPPDSEFCNICGAKVIR